MTRNEEAVGCLEDIEFWTGILQDHARNIIKTIKRRKRPIPDGLALKITARIIAIQDQEELLSRINTQLKDIERKELLACGN